MHARQKFYCNLSGIKLPPTCNTWKDLHWLRCLLSHDAEGYCSLLWVLSSTYLSYLPFSDSTTFISSFLSSCFCPQLFKSRIFSLFLVQVQLPSLSVQKNVNFLVSLQGRHKDSKSAATIKEKEMSKQWERKQNPWTEPKTKVRVKGKVKRIWKNWNLGENP